MIRVHVDRDRESGAILAFRIDGHALFAEKGKDIVCAGVSAVTVGTVNAVESVIGVELDALMDEGKLHVSVPADIPADRYGSLQLLLESMVVMLQTIEESYGAHIRIQEHQL